MVFAFSCILSVPLAHNTTTDLHVIVRRIFFMRQALKYLPVVCLTLAITNGKLDFLCAVGNC